MKLIPFIIPLMAIVTRADTFSVTYNNDLVNNYDNPSRPINSVKCGGKLSKNFEFIGQLPTSPNITGASFINNNTAACGSCWRLSYAAPRGEIRMMNVTVIDDDQSASQPEFRISVAAFRSLTGMQPPFGDHEVSVTAQPVEEADCGLNQVS